MHFCCFPANFSLSFSVISHEKKVGSSFDVHCKKNFFWRTYTVKNGCVFNEGCQVVLLSGTLPVTSQVNNQVKKIRQVVLIDKIQAALIIWGLFTHCLDYSRTRKQGKPQLTRGKTHFMPKFRLTLTVLVFSDSKFLICWLRNITPTNSKVNLCANNYEKSQYLIWLGCVHFIFTKKTQLKCTFFVFENATLCRTLIFVLI